MNKPNASESFRTQRDTETATEEDQPAKPSKQVATRSDLVALHKRMVEMFSTLSDGLGESANQKAATDRLELCDRLDEMERSVNTMEGMLRIELLPQIDGVVSAALEKRNVGNSKKFKPITLNILIAAAAICAGVYWSGTITDGAKSISNYVSYISGN